jgi:hypothetical protein
MLTIYMKQHNKISRCKSVVGRRTCTLPIAYIANTMKFVFQLHMRWPDMALYFLISPVKIIRILELAARNKASSVHLLFCMRIILSARKAHPVLNAPWIVAIYMIISVLLTIKFQIAKATLSVTMCAIWTRTPGGTIAHVRRVIVVVVGARWTGRASVVASIASIAARSYWVPISLELS